MSIPLCWSLCCSLCCSLCFPPLPFPLLPSSLAPAARFPIHPFSLAQFLIPLFNPLHVLSWILTTVAMLYVEKDLSQCVKVAFDKWDTHREMLNHRYFYVANMRISPHQYAQAIEKGIIPRWGWGRGRGSPAASRFLLVFHFFPPGSRLVIPELQYC